MAINYVIEQHELYFRNDEPGTIVDIEVTPCEVTAESWDRLVIISVEAGSKIALVKRTYT